MSPNHCMTDTQLEAAAREYCRRTNRDPDQNIGHAPSPNPDGSVNMVLKSSPQWKLIANDISRLAILIDCIQHGKQSAL